MASIKPQAEKFKTDDTTELSFAEQMAADAFRKNYVRPADRDFVDRKPDRLSVRFTPKYWYCLSDAMADVLREVDWVED